MVELTMPDLAAAMRAAVRGLVDRLDTEQRRRVVFAFDGDLHKRWTYFPGQRPGLRLGDLSDVQLEPVLVLLQLVHSVRGWSDTQLVIRIEAVRRELSLQQAGRAARPGGRRSVPGPAVLAGGAGRSDEHRSLGLADQRPPPAGAGHGGGRSGQRRTALLRRGAGHGAGGPARRSARPAAGGGPGARADARAAGGPAADGADRGRGTRGHRLPLGPGGCATGAAARRFVRTAGPVAA